MTKNVIKIDLKKKMEREFKLWVVWLVLREWGGWGNVFVLEKDLDFDKDRCQNPYEVT